MLIGLCLASFALAVWLITAVPSRPSSRGRSGAVREAACSERLRRARVAAGRATMADVEALLRGRLGDDAVRRVLAQASERRLAPHLLWRWADRFGADRLVLALDAEVAARSMTRHLDAGTVPDWNAMAIFARLAAETGPGSMPGQELVDLDAPAADLVFADLDDWTVTDGSDPVDPAEFAGFGHLPPIAGPARMGTASTVGRYSPDDRLPGPAPQETVEDEEDPPAEGRNWPLAS